MKKIITITVMLFLSSSIITTLYIYQYNDTDALKPIINENPCFSLIHGYTYDIGESVDLCLLNMDKQASLKLINIQTGDTVTYENISYQDYSKNFSYFNQIEFQTNYNIKPKTSGIYVLQITQKDSILFREAFFVNDTTHRPDITYVLSDYTWNAYNTFGGVSNYGNKLVPKWLRYINHYLWPLKTFDKSTYKLVLNRPNFKNNNELRFIFQDSINFEQNIHLVGAEIPLLVNLINRNYNIRVIDCSEFDHQAPFLKSKLFIFNGHSEYWTENMINQLKEIKNRSNVLFTSGNNMFRIVSTKNTTMRVVTQENSQQEVTEILGTFYNIDGYGKTSDFTINDTVPWMSLKRTSSMGKNAVGYETDKTNEFTPAHTVVIAKGRDIPGDLVYIKTNQHYLLNTSSVNTWKGLYDPTFSEFIFSFIDFSINNQ